MDKEIGQECHHNENCSNFNSYKKCISGNKEIFDTCKWFVTKTKPPKTYAYEEMSKFSIPELKELKKNKLEEISDIQAEKEILMANIMSIQNMINKEKID